MPWNIARVLFPTPRDGTQMVKRTTSSSFRYGYRGAPNRSGKVAFFLVVKGDF